MQLHRARSGFDAAGIRRVLIGQATSRHAGHFRRRLGIDLTVLADGRRDSYRAAGAKVGTVSEVFGRKSVISGIARIVRSGGRIRQGSTVGQPAQLGGALVIAADGTVTWSHMSDDASDNASPEEILAAARRAAG